MKRGSRFNQSRPFLIWLGNYDVSVTFRAFKGGHVTSAIVIIIKLQQ